eukprot:tig00020964_g16815.t1
MGGSSSCHSERDCKGHQWAATETSTGPRCTNPTWAVSVQPKSVWNAKEKSCINYNLDEDNQMAAEELFAADESGLAVEACVYVDTDADFEAFAEEDDAALFM